MAAPTSKRDAELQRAFKQALLSPAPAMRGLAREADAVRQMPRPGKRAAWAALTEKWRVHFADGWHALPSPPAKQRRPDEPPSPATRPRSAEPSLRLAAQRILTGKLLEEAEDRLKTLLVEAEQAQQSLATVAPPLHLKRILQLAKECLADAMRESEEVALDLEIRRSARLAAAMPSAEHDSATALLCAAETRSKDLAEWTGAARVWASGREPRLDLTP